MTDKNLSQDVLKKIKSKNLKPKPKWGFLLKNWVFWVLGTLTIILGAISLGITMFLLTATNWTLHNELNSSFFSLILNALPYFWMILLALMTVVTHYNVRHTRKGYKLKTSHLTTGIIIISLISGLIFFGAGTAKEIEEQMQNHMPPYKQLHNMKMKRMQKRIEKFQELHPDRKLPPKFNELNKLDFDRKPPTRPPLTY
ncbi:hypothetical protein HOG48_06335 [Candidatus Peregrinibacteria bacterium]|nr:hypothetical protein [Candidatus Peregrinibacteria bacterium]